MPFDDYTLDPYSGGITFRDSSTGEELLTTPEAGMARMQEIDAQRAALMPGYVPETTGVAYSTELPPMVPPRPSLLGDGSMALAEAPKAGLVARPDVATTTAAKKLDYIGQRVNEALFGPPAGKPVAAPPVMPTTAPAPAPGGAPMSPMDKAKIDRMRDGAATIEVPSGAADTGVLAQAAATPGAVPVAPTTAPAAAPAPNVAAAPPRIVATPNTGAEAAKPPEPPQMVDVGKQTTTTSTGGVERSSTSRREVERAVGMSPATAQSIFKAMKDQGVINADQQDALATGKMRIADLDDEQARIYNAAANDAAIRQRIVEDQTVERYTRAEEYQRQAAEMRVDPARMWKNASTGEKIQLGIAALLGAWGSALQGRQDNAGVKIIEDAIKRDVDLQMQDIAAKREFANDTVRMAKLLMDQGANSKETADYIKNLQILSATQKAKGLAQRAGNWRQEDIDPATGMPKPGTRSYEANRALIDAELKARQFIGNWEAERAGRERVTAESAVKRATQTQKATTTTQQAAAPVGSELAGRGVFALRDPDGKMRYYANMNERGVKPEDAVKVSTALEDVTGDLNEVDRLINSFGNRTVTTKELESVTNRIGSSVNVLKEQGAMTGDEGKEFKKEFKSVVEAKDVARSLRAWINRRGENLKRQSRARELTAEEADKIAASQRPGGDKKLWPKDRSSHRPCASTMRAARRWTRRPTTPSSCCGRSAATAWQRATPFLCVSLASATCAWSRPTRPSAA